MAGKILIVLSFLIIAIPGRAAAVPTTAVTISGNLDATAVIAAGLPAPTSFADLSNAAQFSTFFTVRDSLNAQHTLTAYFFHTANEQWTIQFYTDGSEVGGTAGAPVLLGTSVLLFDSDGLRVGFTAGVPDVSVSAGWITGAVTVPPIGISFDPMTQLAAGSSISAIEDSSNNSCSTLSTCVKQQFPTLLANCAASAPSCALAPADLALTPDVVAIRAIAAARCETRTFRSRSKCRECFEKARKRIRQANSTRLFGEFLNQALDQLRTRRDAACT